MAGRDERDETDRPRDGMGRDNEQKCLAGWDKTLAGCRTGWTAFWSSRGALVYSITSLCGHLSKVDTSRSPELFLLEMNLLNVDTSVFWTVDTFIWSHCSE